MSPRYARQWTAAETELLRELHADGDDAAIAAKLGRSLSSVRGKAKHAGLYKSPARRSAANRANGIRGGRRAR